MSDKPSSDRLEKLRQQQEKLKRKIALEQSRLRDQERKRDTRRKIIAGALVLKHAEIHPAFRETLHELLDKFVERDEDRALFELPPKGGGGREENTGSAETVKAPSPPANDEQGKPEGLQVGFKAAE